MLEALVIALVATSASASLFELLLARRRSAAMLGGFMPTPQIIANPTSSTSRSASSARR